MNVVQVSLSLSVFLSNFIATLKFAMELQQSEIVYMLEQKALDKCQRKTSK